MDYKSVLLVIIGMFLGKTDALQNLELSLSYTNFELFLKTHYPVYHIEPDTFKGNGSLLIGGSRGLETTDGQTTTRILIIFVSSFTQLNRTHVVVVHRFEHCLKILNRENGNFQTLAGTCGYSGYTEKGVPSGQHFKPFGVQLDIRNPGKLIVTDTYNHALVSVDVQSGQLHTITKSGFKEPSSLQWANKQQVFVINYHSYISQVNWSNTGSVESHVVTGSPTIQGDAIGKMEQALFDTVAGVEKLRDNIYLVADSKNRKLKLLDMNQQVVGAVCVRGEKPCSVSSVLPREPTSLVEIEGKMYVAMHNNIYKLTGESFACKYVSLPSGEGRIQLRLTEPLPQSPVQHLGQVHVEQIAQSPYSTCTYHSTVEDFPVTRRLSFRAKFHLPCSLMTEHGFKFYVKAAFRQKKKIIQELCGKDCTLPLNLEPQSNCENDTLTVYWLTSRIHLADMKEPPEGMKKVTEQINQSSLMTSLGSHDSSYSFDTDSAQTNTSRDMVEVALFSTCTDPSQSYDSNTDLCS